MKSNSIDLDRLQTCLNGCVVGGQIIHKPVVDSTNNIAKRLAKRGAHEGTMVLADEQTKGRGRLGRMWSSPKGAGLWFSTILRPNVKSQLTGALSLLPAVAIAEAVEKLFSVKSELKWPNDVMLNHKKFAGILAESKSIGNKIDFVILGVGVNLAQDRHDFSPQLQETATSIFIETGIKPSRLDMLTEILLRMDAIYRIVCRKGTQKLLELWKHYAMGLGKSVVIMEGDERFSGTLEDVTEDGSAILRLDNGRVKKFSTGDCTIIKRKSYATNG
jgi:BirA family biotin operon repressor/biotin-[acetyl-CoA-carboxylase] ligase